MIYVKELRIGNLLNENHYDRTSICEASLSDIETIMEDNHHSFTPIPLTEDWLKKCDFSFNPKFEDLSVAYGITKQTFHFVIGNYYKQIYHLHELQNLYFFLVGEELKINL